MKGEAEILQIETIGTVIRAKETNYLFYFLFVIVDSVHTTVVKLHLRYYCIVSTEAKFFEVSGHNLESSQTWSFCMDFLNQREEGMGFYQVFLLSPLQCAAAEL